MPDEHALLSASSSARWLNCPASVRLTEHLPDSAGEAAAEGTLAHAICELFLRAKYTDPMSKRTFNARLKKLQSDPLYTAEMLEGAELYTDTVNRYFLGRKDRPHITVEHRVDYSAYAPEGFGTADCIIIGGGLLDIVDYKYGKGIAVDATGNTQLMLYALGALREYAMIYSITEVRMTIIQPRNGGVNSWSVAVSELLEWGENIKPIAQSAYDGTGKCEAGFWCDKGFCKIKGSCRVRAESIINADFASLAGKKPPELTDAEVGRILSKAQTLSAWVRDLEKYALDALLAGRTVEGWKAVEGRSNRAITDFDSAAERLMAAGYDEALLYERKPLTLTALESLCGKKQLADTLGELIAKPKGKPTLATESDARPPYGTAADDFAAVVPQ